MKNIALAADLGGMNLRMAAISEARKNSLSRKARNAVHQKCRTDFADHRRIC